MEETLRLLEELKGREDLAETTNFEIAYLFAMVACSRANRPDGTRRLFEELRTGGRGPPQQPHYNCLIVACGSDGAAGDKAFEEMRAAGLEPREADWTARLSCHRYDAQACRRVYLEAKEA